MQTAKINKSKQELLLALNNSLKPTNGLKTGQWREKRSEETKRAVMEATVNCLFEFGYANTTTQSVSDMTGLSRSAMIYHYPSRIDLISAAIDFIFLRMMEMVHQGVETIKATGTLTEENAHYLHRDVVKSREYVAYIELNIAARTDESLRQHFDSKAIAFDMLWQEKMSDLLGDLTGQKTDNVLAWDFARAVMEGMRINERILTNKDRRNALHQLVIQVMEAMDAKKL
ncbi:MAG: TetR/AcrR family transcriptional regulator [Pseudomonadota bacterium]